MAGDAAVNQRPADAGDEQPGAVPRDAPSSARIEPAATDAARSLWPTFLEPSGDLWWPRRNWGLCVSSDSGGASP